jgi:hypothetical protein
MCASFQGVISEYAVGQYELTIRYRDLLRPAADVIIAKRLIQSVARRFGVEACFMAEPFGRESASGMHLHLFLADATGENVFADDKNGRLSIPDAAVDRGRARNNRRHDADSRAVHELLAPIRIHGLFADVRHLGHRKPQCRDPRARNRR